MLRAAERRWTSAERDAHIAAAPVFSFAAPTPEQLDALVEGYTAITRDSVRVWGKRNLIATCYRVHGDDVLKLIAERFRATRTITNLLGDIRCMPRRRPGIAVASAGVAPSPASATPVVPTRQLERTVDRAEQMAREQLHCGSPTERLLVDLVYCRDHEPVFDGRDERRHDRRPSNPEAARFFAAPSSAGWVANRDVRAETTR